MLYGERKNMGKIVYEGFAFDDVLLIPQYSEVLPKDVSITTELVKGIGLNIPLVSAGMDTVTEWELAVALAREGGIGIVHKSMTTEEQSQQIFKVKNSDSTGYDNAVVDTRGRLLVGAAVGATVDVIERVSALVDAGVDIIAVDTAHGYSKNVLNTIEKIKTKFSDLPVIGGNIATAAAVNDLVSSGADCVKVGMGPGAICTTRIVAGIGVPQLSAIMECAEAAEKCGVTLIADGGIKYSGDIVKAIAAGANTVMIGSLFAGTEESPGESITNYGKKYKAYRGMGSTAAMKRSGGDRYFQSGSKKFVPEGVEGLVPYVGTLSDMVYQMIGGLRAGMGYCGTKNIEELRKNGRFVKITGAGLHESHPHDLMMITDEPNYKKI